MRDGTVSVQDLHERRCMSAPARGVELGHISWRVGLDNRLELRVAPLFFSSLARLTGTVPAARA